MIVHAVHQTGKDGNKAGHQPRPDKSWNFKFATDKEWDHGRTTNAPYYTEWKDRYTLQHHGVNYISNLRNRIGPLMIYLYMH